MILVFDVYLESMVVIHLGYDIPMQFAYDTFLWRLMQFAEHRWYLVIKVVYDIATRNSQLY